MRVLGLTLLIGLIIGNLGFADSWSRFRGDNGSGLASSAAKLPADIGPDRHVVWKTELPPGHSSPAVQDGRIFLTAVRDQKLVTIGVDQATGKILWEQPAPHEKLENVHRIGSHAQSSPATDGERVVTFFGSSGLYCYDRDGHELWKVPMGPFKNDFGAGSSPLIADDFVILCQDHDIGSFIAAFDKRTGKEVWRTDRSEFPRNYCTPIIWTVEGRKQIVVAATLRVIGYDLATGKELWTVRGIARFICASPVIAPDNMLYVAGWAAGGDESERFSVQPFSVIRAETDKNLNGTFEEDELPKGDIKQRFTQVDRDKNGSVTESEYEFFRMLFDQGQNSVVAIKPGAKGDATDSHLLWKQRKLVPFCASPIVANGTLFTIKDGGIFASLDVKSGKHSKQGRVSGTDDYYASPVGGDGKIFLFNEEGRLTVVSATKDWQTLHTTEFNEKVYATPAIVDNQIFVRTNGHLFCFGEKLP